MAKSCQNAAFQNYHKLPQILATAERDRGRGDLRALVHPGLLHAEPQEAETSESCYLPIDKRHYQNLKLGGTRSIAVRRDRARTF